MIVVAVPVKDEEACIGPCLRALAGQEGGAPGRVVLLLNDCTDGTAAVVRGLAPSLPMAVEVVERRFGAGGSAGLARRLAMAHAAAGLTAEGVLLTTDADGRVAPDWLAATMAAMRAGAEVVAGRAEIDPEEARLIPAHLHADDAVECAYGAMLDEIEALLDPDPADPWPRHGEHSGASIAVGIGAFRRAGGVPEVAMGEDRALVAALLRVDARVRHAPEVRVTVSGRVLGRAVGGMADTIRRRIVRQDAMVDDRLEAVGARVRRVELRVRFRAAWAGGGTAGLAGALGVAEGVVGAALAMRYCGAGWAVVEAASPVLVRRALARVGLVREMGRARVVLERLRGEGAARAA